MFELSSLDREAIGTLDRFLPGQIWDAHAHLWRCADLSPVPPILESLPEEVTPLDWRENVGDLVGRGRLQGALFLPWPTREADPNAANAFLAEQLDAAPESRGLMLVAPNMDQDRLKQLLEHPQAAGLKPYHVYAPDKPTFQAPLSAFLPEWAWRMADELGLCITIHLARHRALRDEDNRDELIRRCRQFPNAKIILAHAGRGFHAPNTVQGVAALRGLENVYFDTSAICEPMPFLAILREFGPRKLLWGSDFCVSHDRGKCVSVGDNFAWINPHTDLEPVCHTLAVGVESLLALKDASDIFGLNQEDVADIFHDNAMRLLGMSDEPGTLTQDLYREAKTRIPGGTQLLSKRPELLAPDQAPAYYREARGCEFWDLDGRHYYDMSFSGIGACVLGFRDPDVTRAVMRRIQLGSWCTQSTPDEVLLAEKLCELHPWAEQVRFARTGGESAAMAVRIARATTDRSHVAICGYHGWHDWYLAANLGESDSLRGHLLPGLEPLGVPRELRGTSHPFTYNNWEEFQRILDAHGGNLAAVVMEPMRYHEPEPGFLEFVRDGAHAKGALLIFDEITIGWRYAYGGAHLKLGVNPDIAMFAKSLGNGHPIGAVIGTSAAMEGAHDSFISSAYWTEAVGPAAALAVLDKMSRVDVPACVAKLGARIQEAWRLSAESHGLRAHVDKGVPCLPHFSFEHGQATELRALFTQLMLERGFLAGTAFSPTLAHTDEVFSLYEAAMDESFAVLAKALADESVSSMLKGPPAHSGFRRLL